MPARRSLFSLKRVSPKRAFALAAALAAALGSGRAGAEALLLVDAETGRVLHSDNATYPWYPASVTKLMTAYTTLRAVREGRITLDSLFVVSPNAAAQAPTKMGFAVGTQVTVDNALKMLMVKSANDMAVLLAEGVSGSIESFAAEMNRNAQRLGMTQTNYVNPNGLPADEQITSARDLAILARALLHDFPEYDYYWHLPGIRLGKKVVRNYNTLLGRYPGADGMKTGFICASGFNLVATATRNGKRMIAVVLGAPSSAVRAVKAAQLLEEGFNSGPLSWLTPSLGVVDQLAPVDAAPANLHEEMCGPHRKRPAAEEEEQEAGTNAAADSPYAVFLSSLKPQAKGASLLQQEANLGEPVVVFTGPPKGQGMQVASSEAKPAKPGSKAAERPLATANAVPWSSFSPASVANSPPPELGNTPAIPLPRPRPKLTAERPQAKVSSDKPQAKLSDKPQAR
jgi:D-alanyl-D-alanine carboxypeptidase